MELSTRERIIRAAAALLAEGGREAVSSRAVSAAAGVQAPAIFRTFGDMQGMLDAVASYGFAEYLDQKRNRTRLDDPVDDLRAGWDLHVAYGVEHPNVYTLTFGQPQPGVEATAARQAMVILLGLVTRVAEAGRLRLPVEQAARMIHAAGCGVTLTLISQPQDERDASLSERTREAILAAVTTDTPEDGGGDLAARAIGLNAALAGKETGLSTAEAGLLAEWLERIARA